MVHPFLYYAVQGNLLILGREIGQGNLQNQFIPVYPGLHEYVCYPHFGHSEQIDILPDANQIIGVGTCGVNGTHLRIYRVRFIEQLGVAYTDQQFIVGITVYVIGNIGIERKVRIEVMADFFAIHKHHAVSGNGFKMKQEAFPVPAGRHAEVLTQPAHTGVLPIVRIAWVVNGAGRVRISCTFAYVAASSPVVHIDGGRYFYLHRFPFVSLGGG